MAAQEKHEGTHFEDKSVINTEGKMSNKATMHEISSCMERTHAWVSFGFGSNNDNLLHFNEDDMGSSSYAPSESEFLHPLAISLIILIRGRAGSGSAGVHGMGHNNKRICFNKRGKATRSSPIQE